jgi:eukaryotic-like serine/threonine-protein kinase
MSRFDHIGPYTLQRMLGHGTHNQVWLAQDSRSGEDVAVKWPHQDSALARRRLQHELAVARRMDHPNVVAVREFAEYGGLGCLAMEYVAGPSMQAMLAAGLAPRIEWMEELLEALAHAHERGVVHCDIKPANLLIGPDGRLKLGDFGLARLDGAGAGVSHGTPNYMAPEQMRQRADSRSDIYAAGVVLYQLLTGVRPFSGTPFEVMQQTFTATPRLVSARAPQLGTVFDAVVAKALAKSPADRYACAGDFLAVLRQARRGV